jgi:hypothetical protein
MLTETEHHGSFAPNCMPKERVCLPAKYGITEWISVIDRSHIPYAVSLQTLHSFRSGEDRKCQPNLDIRTGLQLETNDNQEEALHRQDISHTSDSREEKPEAGGIRLKRRSLYRLAGERSAKIFGSGKLERRNSAVGATHFIRRTDATRMHRHVDTICLFFEFFQKRERSQKRELMHDITPSWNITRKNQH